jgi:hypothetical protein
MSICNKILLVLTFADPCLRPLTLAERGPRRVLVFPEAPPPRVLFLEKGARARGGASVLIGRTGPATGCRACAFEEKPNNSRKQVQ